MIHPQYPAAAEVDAWCADLLARADALPVTVRPVEAPQFTYQLGVWHTQGATYLEFSSPGRPSFYGYWQPAPSQPAPILFHLPSYAAEISANPELVVEGFHVLHVNPLGYYTPTGPSREDRNWTVLPDTIRSCGERGYVDWLTDAVMAVLWALARDDVYPDRFGFFGASQGGGGALLMASIFACRGARAVAADVPFLTGFARYAERDADGRGIRSLLGPEERRAAEWKALGYVDTLSHAHRLAMPVLLTAGSEDGACPPETIETLFERLPGTTSYTLLSGQGHACTGPFIELARAWLTLHV